MTNTYSLELESLSWGFINEKALCECGQKISDAALKPFEDFEWKNGYCFYAKVKDIELWCVANNNGRMDWAVKTKNCIELFYDELATFKSVESIKAKYNRQMEYLLKADLNRFRGYFSKRPGLFLLQEDEIVGVKVQNEDFSEFTTTLFGIGIIPIYKP